LTDFYYNITIGSIFACLTVRNENYLFKNNTDYKFSTVQIVTTLLTFSLNYVSRTGILLLSLPLTLFALKCSVTIPTRLFPWVIFQFNGQVNLYN